MKKLLCSLFALSAISTAMAQEVNIKLLGTSDVHGRIVPWSYGADVEDKSGSYAQIATYVKDVRKNNKNVVLVEVGDAIQDNQIDVFAKDKKYYKDHPIPKVLNEMNYDIFVLGNHEFNFGMKALDEILKDIKAKKLTANFYHKKNDKRYIDATTIIEKDGVKALDSAEELYKTCQVVSLHIPATAETKNSINYALLKDMPKGAMLVNTARKEVINEAELIKLMEDRADFKYMTDIMPAANAEFAEKFAGRYFSTPKKMGAQTAEANINAGIAAAQQIVGFLKDGCEKFRVNK